jgi:drug/metabolite transporter (DMT)-like permease
MVLSSNLLSEHRDHPALGIWTFIGNLLLMALISAAVRELVNRDYPLSEVLLFRYIFASGFFWIILLSTAGLAGLATQRPLDHAIRGISGIVSLALFYFAITRIPIADATAIAYAAPIFITVLSIFLLGEVIGLRRWLAVAAGFVGVLLIARPEVDGWDIGVIAAAGSAFTGALVAIWLRKLSSSEKSVAIGLYYNNLGALVCLVWVLLSAWLTPRGDDLWLFLGFGLGCGMQQWLLTVSFRYAQASLLAPFEYLAMVFAAIVGFVFWGEVPVATTWIGGAVIAASGLFIFVRRQKHNPSANPVVIE